MTCMRTTATRILRAATRARRRNAASRYRRPSRPAWITFFTCSTRQRQRSTPSMRRAWKKRTKRFASVCQRQPLPLTKANWGDRSRLPTAKSHSRQDRDVLARGGATTGSIEIRRLRLPVRPGRFIAHAIVVRPARYTLGRPSGSRLSWKPSLSCIVCPSARPLPQYGVYVPATRTRP